MYQEKKQKSSYCFRPVSYTHLILYRKEDTAVTFKEAYNHLSYDNGSEKIQSKNKLEDLPELFEQVNQILTTVFGIETVNFIIE